MDHQEEIFSIITWDFANNKENNIFQMGPQEDQVVGNHVVKGMNQKMNYFLKKLKTKQLVTKNTMSS